MTKETIIVMEMLAGPMLPVRNKMEQAMKEEGIHLTFDQITMLKILNVKDEIIQQDLAQHMKRDKSAILRRIDSLEKKKLLVRIPDTEDRRKKHIVMTKTGVEVMEKFHVIEIQISKMILENFTDKELNTLQSLLKKIQQAAK